MKYPIYISSKGRAQTATTMDIIEAYGLDYTLVVDPRENEEYSFQFPVARVISPPFDDLGIGMQRQVSLEHARRAGHAALWQIDDDVKAIKKDNKETDFKKALEYFEERFDSEHIGIISPQFQQAVWRQKELDTVNGQCPCIITLTRTTEPVNYDTELPMCEDLDLMFKFIKLGWDCIMDNRYGFECKPYGKITGKVGGIEYREDQLTKTQRILDARYPGINTRFGEGGTKFRTSWKDVKLWKRKTS